MIVEPPPIFRKNYTAKELAAHLRVTAKAIREACVAGRLRHDKVGPEYRIPHSAAHESYPNTFPPAKELGF